MPVSGISCSAPTRDCRPQSVSPRRAGALPPLPLCLSNHERRAAAFTAAATRTPNLAPEFIHDCEAKLGLRFVEEATGESDSFSPEDVFNYIYAIFHSPLYRERYAEFLASTSRACR